MWQAWLIVVMVAMVMIYIIIRGIKIIHPPEMGLLIIFGKPISVWQNGFHFHPFLVLGELLGCYVVRYPKKLFNLNYPKKTVITKEGWYPEVGENYPKGTRRFYGSQVLSADSTVYLKFPRKKRVIGGGEEEAEHPLFEIYRSSVPTDEEGLRHWTEEAVLSAQRIAFGKITWREAIEDLPKVGYEADQDFKKQDGILIRAGFDSDGIKLTIPEIYLPKELETVLPKYDTNRIEAEAAQFQAKERAIETVGAVVESFCVETGMSQEAVQKALKNNAEKFVGTHKDIWERNWDVVYRRMGIDGKAYLDLRVPGGTTLEGLITLLNRTPMGGGKEKGEQKREGRVKVTQEDVNEGRRKFRKNL